MIQINITFFSEGHKRLRIRQYDPNITRFSVTLLFSHLLSSLYIDKRLKIRECTFVKLIPNKVDFAPLIHIG